MAVPALAVATAPSVAFSAVTNPRAFTLLTGPGLSTNSFSDRRIIEVLAAPEQTYRRLLKTSRRVPEVLVDSANGLPASSVELYGSLALDMAEPQTKPRHSWCQDWSSYYVNGRSDVDFVVEMRSDEAPISIAQRLQAKGPWRMVGRVQVHKFASTQYTLFGSFQDDGDDTEVYLDITCIEHPVHFARFRQRQEAFRKVFCDLRMRLEARYAAQGALAFDAYIHLLKAFAAKIPGNALTGFQATCMGLFTLQIGHFRLKPTQSIALSLFEGFLRFCFSFYGDIPRQANAMMWQTPNYRQYAIDISGTGRWLPRMSNNWRSELYFMEAEMKMKTQPDERVNVTHSLDPARVSSEAHDLLHRAFTGVFDWETPGMGATL